MVRTTRVLRVGPPKRGPWRDIAIGLVGLLILVTAGVLAIKLPVHEDPVAQFTVQPFSPPLEVNYPGAGQDPASITADFTVGQEQKFTLTSIHDDISSLGVKLYFNDDHPASLPDIFTVRLTDPNGNEVFAVGPATVQNDAPTVADTNQTVPVVPVPVTPDNPQVVNVVAKPGSGLVNFKLFSPPEPQVVPAAFPGETAEQATVRLEHEIHKDTKGDWVLSVQLQVAGGCPPADPGSPTDRANLLAAACQRDEGSNGADAGNKLTIEFFKYTAVALDVQPLTTSADE